MSNKDARFLDGSRIEPSQYLGIDFETYCDLSIRDVGLDRYVSHPSFRVLIANVNNVEFDFVFRSYLRETTRLEEFIRGILRDHTLVAQNAAFEHVVLKKLGIDLIYGMDIVDSAVSARIVGASSSLEQAAKQLVPGGEKYAAGPELIRLFSMPNDRNNQQVPTEDLLRGDPELYKQWKEFHNYCDLDQELAVAIHVEALKYLEPSVIFREQRYSKLTHEMNLAGWPVDIPLVKEMHTQYLLNLDDQTKAFYARNGMEEGDLNLNSSQQLQKWAAARGIRMKSFNVEEVGRRIPMIEARLEAIGTDAPNYEPYSQVLDMLQTKQALGGTAPKKLKTILDTVGDDGRLRHQYMHAGAGQSFRTTGMGVQMQNLKRLGPLKLDDMETVFLEPQDNATLGENLRQVFIGGPHEEDHIAVGDFSSVESRGLAWLSGDDKKIQAFRDGKDMYKVAASGIFNVAYEDVTKDQRQVGKVAELSCGYQGARNAVMRFAAIYGVEFTEEGADKLVYDWRDDNPKEVEFWSLLDSALHAGMALPAGSSKKWPMANQLQLEVHAATPPESLRKMNPAAKTLIVQITSTMGMMQTGPVIVSRTFQGCHLTAGGIRYYKPRDARSGDVWTPKYKIPGTDKYADITIYGGKLAGILTQSFCREMFFASTDRVYALTQDRKGLELVGQFHDELGVLISEEVRSARGDLISIIDKEMSTVPPWAFGFPLETDVNSDHRYIK